VIQTISPADVVPVLRGEPLGVYVLSDYVGSFREKSSGGRQAFLVEQKSPELRAHFHEVDQFQVVVGGTGALGSDAVAAGAIHYTDGFTVYGPIRTTDPSGVSYFTLRAHSTVGANFMPESRHKRAAATGLGDHFTCTVELPLTTSPTGEMADRRAKFTLLAESARGARAYACRLGGPAIIDLELLSGECGLGYAVVLSGAVRYRGGRVLPTRSIIFFDECPQLIGLTSESIEATLAVVIFA
jgi:hypothetical protein